MQKIAGRNSPDQNMPDRNLTPGVLSGVQSFIYGYPLVMMGITQRLTTNVPAPNQTGRAPKNQFSHAAVLPNASDVDVQLPNVNSLYSLAGPFSFRLHNKNLIDETC